MKRYRQKILDRRLKIKCIKLAAKDTCRNDVETLQESAARLYDWIKRDNEAQIQTEGYRTFPQESEPDTNWYHRHLMKVIRICEMHARFAYIYLIASFFVWVIALIISIKSL